MGYPPWGSVPHPQHAIYQELIHRLSTGYPRLEGCTGEALTLYWRCTGVVFHASYPQTHRADYVDYFFSLKE